MPSQGVDAFIQQAAASARSCGYARTLLGRHRPIAGLDSEHPQTRSAAERKAVNSAVQVRGHPFDLY